MPPNSVPDLLPEGDWPPPGIHPAAYAPRITTATGAREAFLPARKMVAERNEFKEQMLPGMDDEAYAEHFAKCAPLIARFIGSEFDIQTPGARGLGRTSDAIPRLGGYFRGRLTPDVQSSLGPLIEEILASGFVIAVAVAQLGDADASKLADRELDEIFMYWIPRAFNGLGRSRPSVDVAVLLTERFYGESKKMLVGPFAIRKRLALSKAANFYALSGAALFEASSDLVNW